MMSSSADLSNIVHILRTRAHETPDEIAFRYLLDGDLDEISFTYSDLDIAARTIAPELQSRGALSERVLLLYPPGLDYIKAFFGCLYAGAIAVPIYPPDAMRLQRTMPRFLSVIADADPIIALTTSTTLTLTRQLAMAYPSLNELDLLATDSMNVEDIDWRPPPIDDNTLAFLQYTSGSTANPKGVMLSHGNVSYNSAMIQQAYQTGSGQQYVSWLPFYHDMGLIGGIIQPIYAGGTVTMFSPLHFLQRPLRWLKAISRTKARISGGPNFAYDLCIRKVTPKQLEELDLSTWEVAFNGAEPVRASTLKRFSEAFEPCGFKAKAFYPGYGLAEATLFVTGGDINTAPSILTMNEDDLRQNRAVEMASGSGLQLVSCGYPYLAEQVLIVDPETRAICASEQVGEIWIQGRNVASGYWQQPEVTEQTFGGFIDSGAGPFLRSGDLGFLKHGELYITGRFKDLVIIDGLNHYPQDIESTVERSHPAIRPGCMAAFAVDRRGRERLVVVTEVYSGPRLKAIQLEMDAEITPQSIVLGIRTAIAKEHDIRAHDIVLIQPGTISKTSSGKIQRFACMQDYLSEALKHWGNA